MSPALREQRAHLSSPSGHCPNRRRGKAAARLRCTFRALRTVLDTRSQPSASTGWTEPSATVTVGGYLSSFTALSARLPLPVAVSFPRTAWRGGWAGETPPTPPTPARLLPSAVRSGGPASPLSSLWVRRSPHRATHSHRNSCLGARGSRPVEPGAARGPFKKRRRSRAVTS